MPTGYTDDLDKRCKDARTWILNSLVRNFGICVMMRDDGRLSEEDILKKLKKESSDSSYHSRALKSAKRKLAKYNKLTDKEWTKMMDAENERIRAYNKKEFDKAKEMKERHVSAMKDLKKLAEETHDPVTRNIANFGIGQLTTVKREWEEPYSQELYKSLKKFKDKKIHEATRSVSYHEQEKAEETSRESGRLAAFLKVRNEVNRILGEGVACQG